MAINNRHFVDINIVHNKISTISNIRDTVVVFTSAEKLKNIDAKGKLYVSYADYTADTAVAAQDSTLDAFIKVFFDNSGNKVLVKYTTSEGLAAAITALEDEYIVVAYAATGNYSVMQPIATAREANVDIYGIKQKILLASYYDSTFKNIVAAKNFAVKYSNIIGAEMTIAAYLSNVNINGINTINDYCFTQEVLTANEADETVLQKVLENNMNVVMSLAGVDRNLGGNLTDGLDLINQFVLIVLQQILTEKVINSLAQKIKGSTGLATLYSVIINELSKFKTNGYLTTDKVWLNNTLTTVANGNNYTIIEKGTPLINGYYVTILPLSSLTQEEKAAHKAPYIYVVLADSYGIRTVQINGEVI